jgi:Uma2 family endonuclease
MSSEANMSTSVRLTVEQYDRMIACGVFANQPWRERVELIDGELREMSPIGPVHEDLVAILVTWSVKQVPEQSVCVRSQSSIGIPASGSAPEPDLVWVKAGRYDRHRPLPEDVLLVMEVSDSSLDYDRGEKCDVYAAAEIPEYWVVDIPNRAVHVYRQPEGGRYAACTTYRGRDTVSPLSYPKLTLAIARLFPVKTD